MSEKVRPFNSLPILIGIDRFEYFCKIPRVFVDEDDDDVKAGLGAVKRASCLFPHCLRFYRQRTLSLTQNLNLYFS